MAKQILKTKRILFFSEWDGLVSIPLFKIKLGKKNLIVTGFECYPNRKWKKHLYEF